MRFFTPPPTPEETVDRMRSLKESGVDRESLIAEMRVAGLNIIDCIKVTRDLYAISLGDAKQIVHFSNAWSDMREPAERLHEDLIQVAKDDGWIFEEEPSAGRKQTATAA